MGILVTFVRYLTSVSRNLVYKSIYHRILAGVVHMPKLRKQLGSKDRKEGQRV